MRRILTGALILAMLMLSPFGWIMLAWWWLRRRKRSPTREAAAMRQSYDAKGGGDIPATDRQIAYIGRLAREAEVSAPSPATMAEASTAIDGLLAKLVRSSTWDDARGEWRNVVNPAE